MRRLLITLVLFLASLPIPLVAGGLDAMQPQAPTCITGAYRMSDGSTLDIGPGVGRALRWRHPDGRTGALVRQDDGIWSSTLGWTDRPDGHRLTVLDCELGEIRFDDTVGRRQEFVQIDTRFHAGGVELNGRLTLPPGEAVVPIAVLIHGAEQTSAVETYSLQREFAIQGIGVFAYDKRGTGRSEGR